MNTEKLAPIALFVHNRPSHADKTIKALARNHLAKDSRLFIFSDQAQTEKDRQAVQDVRNCLKSVQGFKELNLIFRDKNYGLAGNIIDGVSTVVNQYDRIIVLEDDCVTSPCFLEFMNEALAFYEREKTVWHVSAWNYPIDPEGLPDTFLWRVMNCWGWATWGDRWGHYRRSSEEFLGKFTRADIFQFNLNGAYDFWRQMRLNHKGRIDTWAIFWYATIFEQKGLCLNATRSLVRNIGHDGSGAHCRKRRVQVGDLNMEKPIVFLQPLKEHALAVERVVRYCDSQKFLGYRWALGILKRLVAK